MDDYSTYGRPSPVPALATQVGHLTVRTTWIGASAATARPGDLPLVWVTEVYPGDPQNHGSTNAGRSHTQAKAYEMHWLTVRRLEHWARSQNAAAGHGGHAATTYGIPRRRARGWLRTILGA
jgi:hypothetical protein